MAIEMHNFDGTFFVVEPKDSTSGINVAEDDIISLTIEEEIGRALSGTIQLNDPEHIYSRLFRTGAKFAFTWGYKDTFDSPYKIISKMSNSQAYGAGYRQKVYGWVTSPSGGGASNGAITYNVSFFGSEVISTGATRVHRNPTKKDVVSTVFSEMGVLPTNQFIYFRRGDEKCTKDTYPVQTESNFRFLLRCSHEWGAIFKIGQDSSGALIGLFSEWDTVQTSAFTKICGNSSKGGAVFLDYMGTHCNVKEYSWQNNAGLNGSGDNVQIVMINGQTQFFRYNAETESVETWTLRPERIDARLRKEGNIQGKTELMKEWMTASTFKEVEWAFERTTSTTAPQGAGYSLEVKMIGDPHVTAGIQAVFGNPNGDGHGGFPDFCYISKGKARRKWWVSKVSHTIDKSGYNMSVSIVDAFTLSGGSMVG